MSTKPSTKPAAIRIKTPKEELFFMIIGQDNFQTADMVKSVASILRLSFLFD